MTRRKWLGLGTAVLTSACRRRKWIGYWGYALIATSGENSLAVVDLSTFQLLKKIALDAPPTEVLPAQGSGRSYVLTPSTDSVHIVGGNLTVASSHRLGAGLFQIQPAPDGKSLFALARHSKELIHAETDSLRVIRRYKLAAEPNALDISKSEHAAVSSAVGQMVELFDLQSGQRKRIELAEPVGAVRFRGDSQVLLATQPDARTIVALDVSTMHVITELPLAMRPENLCFTPDQGQLFVSGSGMDGVAVVFPYRTIEVEQTVLAGRDPGVMACSDEPAYLFVASASGSDVCILNVDSRKLIGIVDVGGRPNFIAITPDNQYALFLNAASGDMAVIHISAINLSRPISPLILKNAASLFAMLGVGSNPVNAAIVPRLS